MNLNSLNYGKALLKGFKNSLSSADQLARKAPIRTETAESRCEKQRKLTSSISANDLLEKHKLYGLLLDTELSDKLLKISALLNSPSE